jgi:hypothetical protein
MSKQIIKEIKEKLEKAESSQRPYFDKFSRLDDLYHSKTNSKYTLPNGSKVFVPISYSFVETILPRMLSTSPKMNYHPQEEQDISKAEIASHLFSYWWDKTNAYIEVHDWVKNALIYGTGILKTKWHSKITTKKYNVNGEAVTEDYFEYKDPKIESCNIYDVFYDPSATSTNNIKWVVHRIYTDINTLMDEDKALKALKNKLSEEGLGIEAENLDMYENLPALKSKLAKDKTERSTYNESRRKSAGGSSYQGSGANEVMLYEYHAENGDIITIAPEQEYIIRHQKKPYWHGRLNFIFLNDTKVINEVYGKGEIEPIEKPQHALNTVVNQVIDTANYQLNFMWKAKDTVEDSELVTMQGNIVHVQDMSDVDVIRPEIGTGQTAFQMIAYLKETMQEALGINDYIKGQTSPDATLGEVEIKTEQANYRIKQKIKLFEEQGLRKLGEIILALYQQFMSQEKVIRIVGETGVKYQRVSPEDIMGRFDVTPEPGSTEPVDPQEGKKQSLEAFQMFNGDQYINQVELRQNTLEKLGFKDTDKLINNTGQMPGTMQGAEDETGIINQGNGF